MSLIKNYEDEDGLHIVVEGVDVSIVNGIRRTILSDIPVLTIRTETAEINQCKITKNTSRFHNEIVKQRLSCIPIYMKPAQFSTFTENYRLVLDVKNDSNIEILWVTTDDFRIQEKSTNQFLNKEEVLKMFPHDILTQQPIDFLRLRPAMGITEGEHIQLSAEFSVSNAKENGMFNVVNKCSFHNVIDAESRENAWAIQLQTMKNENMTDEEIEFERKNFHCLDGFRYYKKNENGEANEFEFIVQTISAYSNYEVMYHSCNILEKKFKGFVQNVQSAIVPIHPSHESRELGYTSVTVSTIENCYDVILENEDYTFGYILEHYLYNMFYLQNEEENSITFVGFKKYHPHDNYSVIRMAFEKDTTAQILLKQYLVKACIEASTIFESLKQKFNSFI
jgi:DNA-directed RNA polymerase subunit L